MHEAMEQAFSLKGKVAVVTGGGSGIGRETCVTFARVGAKVVALDLNESGAEETLKLVREAGSDGAARKVDISRKAEVDAVADWIVSQFGRLDVWVNAAGVVRRQPALEVTEDDMDFQLNTNLKGVYWGCQAAARHMKDNGGGSIISISSGAAEMGVAATSPYAASKAGVHAVTRTFANEFARAGIRVNAVAPGFIFTPMTTPFKEPDPVKREATLKAHAEDNPLGVIGEPRDIALPILFLAVDASRYMTGQVLRPNGGIHQG